MFCSIVAKCVRQFRTHQGTQFFTASLNKMVATGWLVFSFAVFAVALVGLSRLNKFRLHEGFQAVEDLANNGFWFKDWKYETSKSEGPVGASEPDQLSPGDAFSVSTEKLLAPHIQPLGVLEAEAGWDKTTSQVCYQTDAGEVLKKTRNYLQRTNNYPRKYPDSCSAPFHEFLGTFYEPATGGIGQTPADGTNYPRQTQCAN
jgi:hypothetical protein